MSYLEHVAYDQGATAAFFNKARTTPTHMASPRLRIAWLDGYDRQKMFELKQMERFNDEANYTQEAALFQGNGGGAADRAPVRERETSIRGFTAPVPTADGTDRRAAVHEARMQQPVETMAVVEDAWEHHPEPLHHADMQLGMFDGDSKRGN